MMKKNNLWLSSLLAALFFVVGCQKDRGDDTMSGSLSFGEITRCDDTSDKNVNTKAVAPVFSVKVVDREGEVYFSTADISSVEGQKISLPIGEYTVKVWTESASAAAFDTKIYYGEKNVAIFNSVNTPVDVECKLDNVLVDVAYTQHIKDNFESYNIVVENSLGELTFEKDDARVGYFSYENKLSYTILLTDKLGDDYTYTGVVEGLNIRDFVHFNIDVKSRTDKDDLLFDLIVNTTVNEVKTTVTTSLTPNETAKPTLILRGKDINTPIVFGEGVGTDMLFDIHADGGVKRVFINFLSGAPASFPKMVEVLKSDATMLSSLGISTMLKEGELDGTLDMNAFSKLLLSNDEGFHTVVLSVGVYDNAYNLVTKEITLNVVKAYIFTTNPVKNNLIDWSTPRGTTEATFGGTWAMNETPEGLTFGYREVGQFEWIYVDEQLVILDEPNKTYSANVKLYLGKTYEVQAVSSTDAGKAISFTTVRPAEPSNMGFEEWYQDGKTWFPYLKDGVKDWDTGNAGVTSSLAGGNDSNTAPEYVKVKSGASAVKLTSIGVSVVEFAAGNLFTGYFKLNMLNPLSSVHFGRPYAARPIQLKGYYIYAPKVIDVNKDSKDHLGEMDQCNIYVILENWGGADVAERPANPVLIGKGDFRTSESNSSYKEFVIDIAYESDAMPDHIIMVATSSIYGDKYIGGKGSTLYVDEFELVY